MTTLVSKEPIDLFKERTPKSYESFQRAQEVLPGGVTANIKFFEPYPLVMETAEGAYLTDVDGNRYIDYLLAYGALILGHGHYKITNAVLKQMVTNGTSIFGTPHELETEMGKLLHQLYPSIELVRFANSGTEATLLSLRIAHAYTDKAKIAKFEGHYHGGYEQVLWSVNPPIQDAGPAQRPHAVADSSGMSHYSAEQTVILPFNNLEATEAILRQHAHELAAVVLEPVQAGFIPATPEFMTGLRQLTKELGILLILDEVKTGFRVSMGGAQQIYDVQPDLTALGKVLGGGFPVGAVGGKKEIMEVCSPYGKRDLFEMNAQARKKDVLFHSGTYNGHPSILAAGLATIEVLATANNFQHILENTNKLRLGLENVLRYYQIPAQTIGVGSIFNVVLTNEPIRNYRDLQQANLSLRKELDYLLLTLGVYTKPLNRYSMSLVHGAHEIQQTIDAYDTAIKLLLNRKGSR